MSVKWMKTRKDKGRRRIKRRRNRGEKERKQKRGEGETKKDEVEETGLERGGKKEGRVGERENERKG